MDGSANTVVAKVGRELEASEEEDQRGSSKTQNDTEEGHRLVLVLIIVCMLAMTLVLGIQVA